MSRQTRFLCPAAALTLKSLLKPTRLNLCVGLALALGAHAALSLLRGIAEQHTAPRPLTTHFVKRQPRLTKPLDLKKRPAPKQRRVQRKMVAVKAKAHMREPASSIRSLEALGSLARPRLQMSRLVRPSADVLEPQAEARAIEGAWQSQHALDMSLEMLDIDALDTGRYQAMVVQDPTDKRNIRGYLHLVFAYPFSVDQYDSSQMYVCRLKNGLRRLIARLSEWTDIQASLDKQVTFDSPEFFNCPWIYLWVDSGMNPARNEVDNLGKYLLDGGFFFFEGANYQRLMGQRHLKQFVTSALESRGYRQGVHWELQLLPNSHPLFQCYFDFPEGAPPGNTMVARHLWGQVRNDGVEPWTRGIEINGRLVALNTNQVYLIPWSDWGNPASFYPGYYEQYAPTLQFRFGINTIIFALTQEGSITRRVMDSVQ